VYKQRILPVESFHQKQEMNDEHKMYRLLMPIEKKNTNDDIGIEPTRIFLKHYRYSLIPFISVWMKDNLFS